SWLAWSQPTVRAAMPRMPSRKTKCDLRPDFAEGADAWVSRPVIPELSPDAKVVELEQFEHGNRPPRRVGAGAYAGSGRARCSAPSLALVTCPPRATTRLSRGFSPYRSTPFGPA